MKAFEYANPSNKDEVVQLLQKYKGEAAVLAGGTDLLSLMKDEVENPSVVVNIKNVADAKGISQDNNNITIGALTTLDELLDSKVIQMTAPALVDAARGVTSPQIRSQGTVGGDLCQRPRCWYYRNGFGLLAMKDGSSLVVKGDNRYHAILGSGSKAYFVNPSSLAPALMALGGHLRVFGAGGDREVPMNEFFRVPENEGERENSLSDDEMVVQIVVPKGSAKSATYEVREREALDWPLAAAAVSLLMSGNQVTEAKVALGHVAPTPWMAMEAGSYLAGKTMNEAVAESAAKLAVAGAAPLTRNAYKVRLARTAVKRALLRAAGLEVLG